MDTHDTKSSMLILYELSCLIKSKETLREKLLKALGIIRKAVEYHSASLFMYNDRDEKLEEMVSIGSKVELIENTEFDMGTGMSAWVAKQRDSVLLPDVHRKSRNAFRSFISAPLISGDKLIGVMNIGHKKPGFFTENHLRFFEIVAGQLAETIERTLFERKLIEKNTALELAQKEIQKQHEQILEMEKTHVLAQIAASINHEINNPLTTIIGNIELLLMKGTGMDEMVQQKLKVILGESRRIQVIVEKIRDMKKIVLKDYLKKYNIKMIDLYSSAEDHHTENLS